MTKTILLLGATFETANMGVGALTAGALKVLTCDPSVEVRFLDYGVQPRVSSVDVGGRIVHVPLINLRFSWKVLLPNNVATLLVLVLLLKMLPERLRSAMWARNRCLRLISEAHGAVAISGGDSFSDIYGMARFFYVWMPQLLLVLMGKELTLLPQTIGPFDGRLARMLARFVMRRAQAVYSRDAEGMVVARRMLGLRDDDTKVQFCYDLGFLCEPHPPTREDLGTSSVPLPTDRPLVGLNVSGLLMMGGYGRDNAFELRVAYPELIECVVRRLIEQRGVNVLLVPHVFGSDAESDTIAVEAVFRQLGSRYAERIFCVRGKYDQSEIKHIIGRCDFFIGSRMHACIAALSQAIPAVAIAYSRKFVGVLRTVGAERLVADPREMDIDAMLALIDRALDDRIEIRTRLRATMPIVHDALFAVSGRLGLLCPAHAAAA